MKQQRSDEEHKKIDHDHFYRSAHKDGRPFQKDPPVSTFDTTKFGVNPANI